MTVKTNLLQDMCMLSKRDLVLIIKLNHMLLQEMVHIIDTTLEYCIWTVV